VGIGAVAVGLLAVGAIAVAAVAVGAVSVGVIAIGAVATGLAATGALVGGGSAAALVTGARLRPPGAPNQDQASSSAGAELFLSGGRATTRTSRPRTGVAHRPAQP
jgi:hypothetical protein